MMNMFDPEMMRLAQEQMSRMGPEEMARIQQQMMSNPELMRLATDSMRNMRPEDVRRAAEQLRHTRPEEMAEIGEKMANVTPEEVAAMKARADAQVTYELNAAKMLKEKGNELHSRGKFSDATTKYLLAKENLKGVPTAKGGTLQLQCSLNLMSCYLRTKQFDDCIKEGSEVLSYDTKNVKALYRRGQAYKELGMLEAAVSDLEKAHELSPEDETIADVLRGATEGLMNARKSGTAPRGLVIEEIAEEETRPLLESHKSSSVENSVTQAGESSQSVSGSRSVYPTADAEIVQSLKDDPESIRLFQNYLANVDPSSLAAVSEAGLPPDMVKTATEMINKMKPEELQKMLQLASSLNGKVPMSNGSILQSQIPGMTPEMLQTASEQISKMSPEELQRMAEIASSLNVNGTSSTASTTRENTRRSENGFQPSVARNGGTGLFDSGESTSGGLFNIPRMGPSSSIPPNSTADVQESMRNSMKDPAMQQMFTSMIKNMSPEMMSNMSEQFGMKLSKEDAAKAQQAMSSLSPDDLDKMMRWAGRAQSGIETVRKTKNLLMGKSGMIIAILVLILAFILNRLGFIGA